MSLSLLQYRFLVDSTDNLKTSEKEPRYNESSLYRLPIPWPFSLIIDHLTSTTLLLTNSMHKLVCNNANVLTPTPKGKKLSSTASTELRPASKGTRSKLGQVNFLTSWTVTNVKYNKTNWSGWQSDDQVNKIIKQKNTFQQIFPIFRIVRQTFFRGKKQNINETET